MITTANFMRPGDPPPPPAPTPPPPITHTVAERMAKMRAAKEAKKAERLAKAGGAVREAGVQAGAMSVEGTCVEVQPLPTTYSELKSILLELRTMFGYGSPRGHELCAKALRLLEENT